MARISEVEAALAKIIKDGALYKAGETTVVRVRLLTSLLAHFDAGAGGGVLLTGLLIQHGAPR